MQCGTQWRLAFDQIWRLQLGLAEKSFEKSQAGARQLVRIILTGPPPLLQMTLKQAPALIRLMNIVRGSVYPSKLYRQLPAAGLHPSFPASTREETYNERYPLAKVSSNLKPWNHRVIAIRSPTRLKAHGDRGTSSIPDDCLVFGV
jgi:hypothetical protein